MEFAFKELKRFINEEEGIGVVEIILILVILIGIVIIFKDEIGKIVDKAVKQISSDTNKIIK